MKRSFITGLVILLPLAVTLAVTFFIVDLFTGPFIGIFQELFRHYGIFEEGLFFLSADQVQLIFSQVIILVLLFFTTVFLGLLTRWVFIHYFIRLGDYIFHRIPIVRTIYKTSQDVIKALFTTEARSFKQVVLVPFPQGNTRSIGLLTRENLHSPEDPEQEMVAVFVPTTPNPTSGFLMLFRKEEIIYLDIRVEEAFKYIISCGVVQDPFNKRTAE